MKKIFTFLALTSLLTSSVFAEDFLAKLTKGALSDTSPGVKELSLEEMKQVKGGWYPVEAYCRGNNCFAFADHQSAAANKTLTPAELVAWRTATLEQNPETSSYFLGFMAQNNWSVSSLGKPYNYFTYTAVMLAGNGKIYKLSSQVLNNNLIIRQLSNQYKNQFDRHLGGLQIGRISR